MQEPLEKGYQLGVDVGGTFTDVYVFTPYGQTVRAKVPTSIPDQSIGIQQGIAKARELLKKQFGWSGAFQFIHHGTTTATNAVLEGKGARTALIVTAGHKDILALRRSQIPGGLGAWLHWTPPEPIVPLERVVQCKERMSVQGETVTAVDIEDLRQGLKELARQKPEAIAISLLNSHSNEAHERVVAQIVREELGADIAITCSTDVLREVGEYERTVTTCTNTLVKPVVEKYLFNLSKLLAAESEAIRVLKSDGGLTSLTLASELPVNNLISGPAGGVKGVADVVARSTLYKNLITLDMGGTSTDCALIYNGQPQLRRETVVESLSVRAPAVDIKTVGAGGGSITTYMELTETLRVGPESAGAAPGPASYGKGGKQAMVTDANLVLGYLPKTLLGGEFALDVQAAITAVEDIANQMKLPVIQTAEDIITIINETMYGALRLVSVEQGYDPREFALVAFGGAGPLHANAVGQLLGAWPVIIPPSPGILCAQGDVTTKLRHEQSTTFIRIVSGTTVLEAREQYQTLEQECRDTLLRTAGDLWPLSWKTAYQADLRYKCQALMITIEITEEELALATEKWHDVLRQRFDQQHQQMFTYCLPDFELELMRLGVVLEDASPGIDIPQVPKEMIPPSDAKIGEQNIIVQGEEKLATLWDRQKISKQGIQVTGPCIISEMDSNTLILPGYYGEIDSIGNILINPVEKKPPAVTSHTADSAKELVKSTPLIPTLISSTLASIRGEMDKMMLRCSMSPAIREQQDEFNVITDCEGKMLVGQFGSFITQFLDVWNGTIEEGDVFITNDTYQVQGAISHLNDIIAFLPIFHNGRIIGFASQFGHLTDVGGIVPGSMSINATSIFDDGVQIPCIKLYTRGVMNKDLVDLLCRNSRQPAWYRSDLTAIVASCSMAATRVRELATRFGSEVYLAACSELLYRNRSGFAKIIERQFDDLESKFTDFVDDDGHGVGPWALTCSMKKVDGNRLQFDWSGTSPQSERSINFYLSETMFRMFIGYYLIAAAAPGTVINDGFHDLIDVYIPQGSDSNPFALHQSHQDSYQAAAGFSDSPHFFYAGFKPDGEWYQLYQIGFGGMEKTLHVLSGSRAHREERRERRERRGEKEKLSACSITWLMPRASNTIKSIPTEMIELNYPLRIEANESVADSGGAGFYRGGNVQRTLYRFLARGEFSLHDDRWFTKPWGLKGRKPGQRSRKILYRYSKSEDSPPTQILPSKCDHIRVDPGDLLEWLTWGGGGLGDPLTRPAEKIALEVHRKLVTVQGARVAYGTVVNDDFTVNEAETEALRTQMRMERSQINESSIYDRGGSLEQLREICLQETGLDAPLPQ
ncbi:hypothetical protein N7465_003776 [Penicillium sp. CMV-2018d]|nr:hypothetical protein N7465_003776 [Penicillium sp. CMV-2018d]